MNRPRRVGAYLIGLSLLLGAAGVSAATPPTETTPLPIDPREMAPLVIPSANTPLSRFPKQLENVCNALSPQNGAAAIGTATSFRQGALGDDATAKGAFASLNDTCGRIKDGSVLTKGDIDNLEQFRKDPASAIERLNALAKKNVATPQTTVGAASTSSGSLESDIINGLAKFIYDRAKQEGVLYLRSQLDAKLCSPDGDPHWFFPAVCVALRKTEPTIPLGAIGSYLTAAARTDLRALPDRSLAYDLHFLKSGAPAGREALFGARLGLTYYLTVSAGRAPLDVARSFHAVAVDDVVAGHDAVVLKAVKVVSEVVDGIAAQDGWSQVASAADPLARYYALGAIFSMRDLYVADGAPLGPLDVTAASADIPVIAQAIVDLAALQKRAEQAALDWARALSAAPAAVPSSGSWMGAAGATPPAGLTQLDLALTATHILERELAVGARVASAARLLDAESAATLIAVTGSVRLGEQILAGASAADTLILADGFVDDVSAAVEAKCVAAKAPCPLPRALSDVRQLLALVAQVADAKSADEVANVLDAAAAPATSYESKYDRPVVAIGAMVGVAAGFERVEADGRWRGFGGAFAPVGFTASTPVSSKVHLGAMLSVLNLGALVSARFNDDVQDTGTGMTSIKPDPRVKLANVFAPGAFLNVGLCRSPFVLSVGGQVVPAGREVTMTSSTGATTSSSATAIQGLVSLSLDVPIFVF